MSHITFNNGNMIYQYIIEFHKVFFFYRLSSYKNRFKKIIKLSGMNN